MSNLISNSFSALNAYQQALAVVSHNVANATTEGYSRQTVLLSSTMELSPQFGSLGTGVKVFGIERNVNDFISSQLNVSQSSLKSSETFSDLAGRISHFISDDDFGISPMMNNFFSSINDFADDPSNSSTRLMVLSSANTLVDRFDAIEGQISQIAGEVNQQMTESISEVNALAGEIAALNEQLLRISDLERGTSSNDLLDKRDLAVHKLSALVGLQTLVDGSMINIYLPGGQALVLGTGATELAITLNDYDPTRLEISAVDPSGLFSQDVTHTISGGELGGLINMRRDVLDATYTSLGKIATAVVIGMNAVHNEGLDANGNLGGDLFTLAAPVALPKNSNTGTDNPAVTITDLALMDASEYSLNFVAGAYQLLNLDTNTVVPMAGAGTALSPFTADGLSIVVLPAAAVNGDSFLIRPTYDAAKNISVAISNVNELAGAAPMRTQENLNNKGTAIATQAEIFSFAAFDPLMPTVTIDFIDGNNYRINGALPDIPWISGDNIQINGWEMQISGVPETGDQFTIEKNTGGLGDNRNALKLANFDDFGLYQNGAISINDSVNTLTGEVATLTRRADLSFTAQQSLFRQLQGQRESVSGVNLDEEAMNLTRYKQAYQAAAQVASIADELFDDLMNAVR
ncbi:MAG: flagellar hook-associated protein FlgK [Pseudomonadales bacterium]|nr:flagellar hook-associated protein FlgK [Pseudomonadales bacterium]